MAGQKDFAGSLDTWRRHALFCISIAFLSAGLFLASVASAETEFLRGLCLKVGMVLLMLWLALPQLQKMNWWAVLPVIAVAAVAVVRPQMIVVLARVVVPLAPVLFLIWLFWSPNKNTKAGR